MVAAKNLHSRLLLVEDVDSLREVLTSVLETEGFKVIAAASAEEALPYLKDHQFDCILADFKLPGMNGIELLEATRVISKTVPYIIMTAYGSIEIAVEAMKNGANDFICKPFEPSILAGTLRDVIEHRRIVDRSLGLRGRRDRRFLSKSPKIQKLLNQVGKVARVDSSVLILGESGTGKELIARAVHEQSDRAEESFVAVNCAAMPADLLESEFFGHEAGSFTGATQTRIGVLELASNGTLFLDEIGDMPPLLQVKLLRALQEREIKRVGGTKVIKVNPRIIAATNVNPQEALESGILREDFYYRVAVISFTVPPLRERREDIQLLADYFVEYFCMSGGRDKIALTKEARETLMQYHWPGNVRELENLIERAVIMADKAIRPEHLNLDLNKSLLAIQDSVYSLTEISNRAAQYAEIEIISRILRQTMGNKSKAAQLLGVSYKTLLNKVKEYQLEDAALS